MRFERGELFERSLGEVAVLKTGAQGLYQFGFFVDDLLECFCAVVQFAGDAMLAQALSDDVVFFFEEVVAQVAQEVVVADEIRYAVEDCLYRVEDALAHVVDQGDGRAEELLYVLEEGYDLLGLF